MSKQVKVITVKFTMFNVEGEQDFFDCTVLGAKRKIKNQCDTAIIHKVIERDVEVISEQTIEVEDKFEIVPTHEQNK